MFLGLPDPDPIVRGMDPDPDPEQILLPSCKNSEKNLDSYYFVTLYDSLKNDVNVASKSNKQKKFDKKKFLFHIFKVTDEISRIRRSQRYGSADPGPYQNVTDPQHWF